ncbi:UBP-type zinc finger domain-containing protein [Gordonia sp. NB41Y]|uniref:UBP-type zinc finger domain-containing protein n=1 Tax=Gordonia sp. NB41Y TaxID=875808 RepID=UPI0006B1CCE8|nr:UBP-type zinc finger domain-containing protein [Gordonia sp. NB41Y]EMP10421.2 zinc finger UBP-type domain-containing protein [Gordonia sp. NB41Y]WLP89176.1 UBP-type zinc finger domain-containing protein [Gordonia sp. NB41Y]
MRMFGRGNGGNDAPGEAGGAAARCPELGTIGVDEAADPPAATGRADECEDCVAMGEHHWSHLRKCLECGHIGCCDSSPRRHATAHFHDSGHPVMRSAEPGERWRWCYVHEVMG